MNTDVFDIVQRYRATLRHTWNSCFWVDPKLRNWDSVYAFRNLKLPLFRAIVGNALELEPTDRIFGEEFQIVPNGIFSEGFPYLQIDSRKLSIQGEGTWLRLNGPFRADDVRLTLMDLFDW